MAYMRSAPSCPDELGPYEGLNNVQVESGLEQIPEQNQPRTYTPATEGCERHMAQHGCLATLFRAPDAATRASPGAQFSPDGHWLLWHASGPHVQLLNAQNGEEAASLEELQPATDTTGPPATVLHAAFDQTQGKAVIARDDGEVLVYNVRSHGGEVDLTRVMHMNGHDRDLIDPAVACQIAPDGASILVGLGGGRLQRWRPSGPIASVRSQAEKLTYQPSARPAKCEGEPGRQATGVPNIPALQERHASIRAAFCRGCAFVVSCSDAYDVVIMDDDGKVVLSDNLSRQLHKGHKHIKPGCAISPDGRWVAVFTKEHGPGDNLALYDTTEKDPIPTSFLRVSDGAITQASFSPEGTRFVVASSDDSILVVTINVQGATQVQLEVVALQGGHAAAITACCVGLTNSISSDPSNAGQQQVPGLIKESNSKHKDAAQQQQQQQQVQQRQNLQQQTLVLSGDSDGHVVVWVLETKQPIVRLQARQPSPILHVAIGANGKRAVSVGQNGDSLLWYLGKRAFFNALHAVPEELTCCAVAGDETLVVGTSAGALQRWKLSEDQLQVADWSPSICERWEHTHHQAPVSCVAVLERKGQGSKPAGIVASGGCNGRIVLTSYHGWHVLFHTPSDSRQSTNVTSLAFHHSGDWLVSLQPASGCFLWRVHYGELHDPQGRVTLVDKEKLHADGTDNAVTAFAMGQPDTSTANVIMCGNQVGVVEAWHLPKHPLETLTRSTWVQLDPRTAVTAISIANNDTVVGCADGSVVILNLSMVSTAITLHESFRMEVKAVIGSCACPVKSLTTSTASLESTNSSMKVVAVGSSQALSWEVSQATGGDGYVTQQTHTTDFVPADRMSPAPRRSTAGSNCTIVPYASLTAYDPTLHVAMCDLSPLASHVGDSCLFRDTTSLVTLGDRRLVLCAPPVQTMTMLDNGSIYTCMDISPCGNLLVAGDANGELYVWNLVYGSLVELGKPSDAGLYTWVAHRRSKVAFVKWSSDGKRVISAGGAEDRKVIVWNWRQCKEISKHTPHTSAITGMDVFRKPTSSGDKPTSSGEKPTSFKDKPASFGDKPTSSGDKPASFEHTDWLATCDQDGVVIRWCLADDSKQSAKDTLPKIRPGSPALSCAIHHESIGDGSLQHSSLLVSSADQHVHTISVPMGIPLKRLHLTSTSDAVQKTDHGELVDGKMVVVKYSPDGKRALMGGSSGELLVWDTQYNYLLHVIKPQGKGGSVLDCCWSADGRRVLSVGEDGMARLWDAEGGGELCQASVEERLGLEDSGFIKCALSPDGSIMAGITAKGHLVKWDVARELQRQPNPQALMDRLTALPVEEAREQYAQLLAEHPLLNNVQDSHGKTLLMHAVEKANVEVVRMIVGATVKDQASLGLISSPVHVSPRHEKSKLKGVTAIHAQGPYARGPDARGPDALALAVGSRSADCVHMILNAVLKRKVTQASYLAVSRALQEIATLYPDICETFLVRLPLQELGEVEVPIGVVKGTFTLGVTSYTSYKADTRERLQQLQRNATLRKQSVLYNLLFRWFVPDAGKPRFDWTDIFGKRGNCNKTGHAVSVRMTAALMPLPFVTTSTDRGLLHTLIRSKVGVNAYGSDTVRAVIRFKWDCYAKRNIVIMVIAYLVFVALFTVYAVFISKDPGPPMYCTGSETVSECSDALSTLCSPVCTAMTCTPDGVHNTGTTLAGLATSFYGRGEIALSFVIAAIAAMFFGVEVWQLCHVGLFNYLSSIWNWLDITSYGLVLAIPPLVLLRKEVDEGGSVYILVAAATLLLYLKSFFFGLAVDHLGTFVYMIKEIIKGLWAFYLMVFIVFVAFSVALLNLFRPPPDGDTCACNLAGYDNFGNALISLYQSMFQNQFALEASKSNNPVTAIIVLCLATFLCNVVLINLIITLMGDLFSRIKLVQDMVFQKNRADLIVEVDSIMYSNGRHQRLKRTEAPYLLMLLPITQDERDQDLDEWASQWNMRVEEATRGLRGPDQPGDSGGPDDGGDGGGGGGSGYRFTTQAHRLDTPPPPRDPGGMQAYGSGSFGIGTPPVLSRDAALAALEARGSLRSPAAVLSPTRDTMLQWLARNRLLAHLVGGSRDRRATATAEAAAAAIVATDAYGRSQSLGGSVRARAAPPPQQGGSYRTYRHAASDTEDETTEVRSHGARPVQGEGARNRGDGPRQQGGGVAGQVVINVGQVKQ